ncbi:hypothetical protein A2778_05575 [Candidatus Daviesbacteria bacterium RIFCSPHIGHO2_01_FULL_40_24]|uniref:DUF2933 domain-containing protein n=1 Tax=Candidatus Daviesbacteria bacterium GW2011_GWC2_40_12 TaxID=1618431 RepID=A0A0G0QZC7_9BACT|nr:MAG: hypothetical protein UT04_C0073G0006 [Candidatus Daviesbacteria bacterium GW2011_GWF2_38_7]KKR42796.1 MAG: hypothetical protein UT77_C0001G0247 [Candidatus Daviesbacteria bacterium GW2011_GWC2_40_12]OGE21625.1 MAG: hypothetical protein A2778_05575 [Candidatus Daviesbacteria bacterium RIFCSPHIGHO2_01_FULL_40_24]OGE30022.1 MAG: hypothetical protein A3C29_01280 [Candidatus Daviesbacteria bacterium RIFCSPHIGHO2_02_FULL_40_16]OGE43543.1 MAG: hypothetical protein A3A53_02835 [Candidatus Davie
MGSLKLTKGKLLLGCLVVLAGTIIAVTIFKVPFGSLLYFGIFLACPLMHIFMMKGHGDHNQEGKDNTKQDGKSCH